MLSERLQKIQVYRDNWQGALNLGSAKYVPMLFLVVFVLDRVSESPLLLPCNRPETIAAAINIIREKYGGADEYLVGRSSLIKEDLDEIRKNFLVPRSLAENQVVA